MSTFSTRFTPIDALSLGTQQLALGTSAVLATALFSVPSKANSAWLQVAGGDMQYRMNGRPAGSEWLTLSAGTVLPLSNKQMLVGLVLRSASGTVQIVAQFFRGAIGPMAPYPKSSGGSGPPPTPGITAIPVDNCVHVMKNGSDGTGARNRFDLPYETITAAKAVMQPGDTMCIWAGQYNEGGIDVINVTYLLIGAEIVGQTTGISGSTFVFTGTGNVTISGTGTIRHAGGDGSQSWCIYAATGSGKVWLDGPEMRTQEGTLFECRDGWTGEGYSPSWTSVLFSLAQYPLIVGDTTTRGPVAGFGQGLLANSTKQVHYGTVDIVQGYSSRCETGSQVIYGDLSSSQSSTAVNQADQRVYGNVVCLSADPSAYAISCLSGSQNIYGNVFAVASGTYCDGGDQVVTGSIASQGSVIEVANGTMVHNGNIEGLNDDFPLIRISGGALVLSGRIANADTGGGAALVTISGGQLILAATARLLQSGANPRSVAAASAQTIKSYGAYANKPISGLITVQGSLNVEAWVE